MLENELIDTARGWLGTRFCHQGRRKHSGADPGGVDCLGLLIGVAEELGLRDRTGQPFALQDCRDYSRQPDGLKLRGVLAGLLGEIPQPVPGAVGLFLFDGNAQHLALFGRQCIDGGSHLSLIHAYAPARRVIEHRYDTAWQERLVTVFAFPAASQGGQSSQQAERMQQRDAKA